MTFWCNHESCIICHVHVVAFGGQSLMWPNLLFHLKPQTFNRFFNELFIFGCLEKRFMTTSFKNPDPQSTFISKTMPLMEVLCCRPVGATKACVTARPAPMAAILDTAPIGSKGTKRVWLTFVYLKKSISLARRRKDRTLWYFLFVVCLLQEMHGTRILWPQTRGNSASIPQALTETIGSSTFYCVKKTSIGPQQTWHSPMASSSRRMMVVRLLSFWGPSNFSGANT